VPQCVEVEAPQGIHVESAEAVSQIDTPELLAQLGQAGQIHIPDAIPKRIRIDARQL
jgi:hypothetical protein